MISMKIRNLQTTTLLRRILFSITWLGMAPGILFFCTKRSEIPESIAAPTDILDDYNAKELIDAAGRGLIDISQYGISADDQNLQVRKTGKILPMPRKEFYLAVAPYQEHTHPCQIHSVSSCQGELPNAEMAVQVTDAGGSIILDKSYTTGQNGFINLWLPRNLKNAQLEIRYAGQSARKNINTVSGAPTCETTMQLKGVLS